jgi:hypothetical protein
VEKLRKKASHYQPWLDFCVKQCGGLFSDAADGPIGVSPPQGSPIHTAEQQARPTGPGNIVSGPVHPQMIMTSSAKKTALILLCRDVG